MSDELIAMVLEESSEKMINAVDHVKRDFSGVRSGKATPALVDKMSVEYYGSQVPLQQLAGFSVPEARMLVITPFDKTSIDSIERAIQQSDLGLSPSNDGVIIRLSFPPLTEERRKDLVKIVKSMAEDGRIAIRNARRSARQDFEQMKKDGEVSEDVVDRAEKQLDSLTQAQEGAIDAAFNRKEEELLEV